MDHVVYYRTLSDLLIFKYKYQITVLSYFHFSYYLSNPDSVYFSSISTLLTLDL